MKKIYKPKRLPISNATSACGKPLHGDQVIIDAMSRQRKLNNKIKVIIDRLNNVSTFVFQIFVDKHQLKSKYYDLICTFILFISKKNLKLTHYTKVT